MQKTLLFTVIAAALLFSACKKDKLTPLEELPYGQYLKTMNDLAAAHGLKIEKELRKLQFEQIEGYAESENCDNKIILVPRNYEILYGQDFTGQFIYHQIGHCILGRKHKNDVFANGEWKSLMREAPYLGAEGQACDFDGKKKDYYLEELFNENADPADFGLETEPIPFDESIQRVSQKELECGYYYEYLVEEGVNFDIDIKFEFHANPGFLNLNIFEGPGEHYLGCYLQPNGAYGKLVFSNLGFGPRFAADIHQIPDFEHGFTMTIRNYGGKCLIYFNKKYVFSRLTPPVALHEMNVSADTQIGCLPQVKIYRLN